ncbi:hypothetical protein VN21_07785 [Paraclostridium benzoelyticum]|uniref:Phage-like protein n=1 Tax=Paraclostridium benzoelyticum TaxID=1629550 RepID=A0A0M3DG61_9FIRM|nr:phage holin [Paraclostridium benzoelyticum]KKY00922.1 hypothetical protein VN21_11440 [Paraclostridium benzoelyticum]KKY01615.1 hypothetical protein VN21_07785 [Paraclostridium benzoelyticum]
MSETVFQMLIWLISVVITVGGGYLIIYLKNKIGSEKLSSYYNIAKMIVMSIEQTQTNLTSEEKKQIAVDHLKKLTKNKLSDEEIDRLIESSVYEIKKLILNNKL